MKGQPLPRALNSKRTAGFNIAGTSAVADLGLGPLLMCSLLLCGGAGVLAGEPRERATLRGHSGPVYAVVFTPDGQTLISVGGTPVGQVKLWNVASGKERASPEGLASRLWCVALSPDGRTLATGGEDATVRL
jgi:WD40 repeat protein